MNKFLGAVIYTYVAVFIMIGCSSFEQAVKTTDAVIDAKYLYDMGIEDEFRDGFNPTIGEIKQIDSAILNMKATYNNVERYKKNPAEMVNAVLEIEEQVAVFKANYMVLYNIAENHWDEYTVEGQMKLTKFNSDLQVAEKQFEELAESVKTNERLNMALSVIKTGAKIAVLL
jgi:hypothetical protein